MPPRRAVCALRFVPLPGFSGRGRRSATLRGRDRARGDERAEAAGVPRTLPARAVGAAGGVDGGTLDTFPRLMLQHARVRPGHPATREKDLGIWQTWTWAQVADEVRALACGLAAQGLRARHAPRDHRRQPAAPVLVDARRAGLGGVPVPMYQDAPAAEFVYVLNDAEIAYAIVEDQEQVDKLLEAQPQVPTLRHIVLRRPARPAQLRGRARASSALQAIGREFDRAHPGFFDAEVAKGQPDDVVGHALHVGHDRQAEGRAPDACARSSPRRAGGVEFDRLTADDSVLSYLPMAWVGDHLFSLAQWMVRGLHDQLSGVGRHGDDRPARDRSDLLLRAAARSSSAC